MVIDKVKQFIKIHNLIPPNSKIILGLSGGPDSIFLLHLLAEMKKKGIVSSLIAAHLDHEWRPDSFKDVTFCQEATSSLGIPLVTKKISELSPAIKFDGSQEEIGRKARRYFLEQVRDEYHAHFIALAHHLQDQEETFFIRLIRGTTLTGLTAMWPKHGCYIRPLLEINKSDIIDYLNKHTISYLTDPSNMLPEFLRNRIRTTVLPAIHACDDRFDKNFLSTLNRLQATELFLQELTHKTYTEILEEQYDHFCIDIKKLFSLNPVLQYRVLMYWLISQQVPFPPVQSFLDEIIRFLQQPESKDHHIHKKWRIVKKKNVAYIEKN